MVIALAVCAIQDEALWEALHTCTVAKHALPLSWKGHWNLSIIRWNLSIIRKFTPKKLQIIIVPVQMTWYPKYSSPTVNQAQTGHTPIWTLQLCVLLFSPFIKHSFKPAFKAALFNNQPIWIPTPLNLQNLLTLRLWDSTVQEYGKSQNQVTTCSHELTPKAATGRAAGRKAPSFESHQAQSLGHVSTVFRNIWNDPTAAGNTMQHISKSTATKPTHKSWPSWPTALGAQAFDLCRRPPSQEWF